MVGSSLSLRDGKDGKVSKKVVTKWTRVHGSRNDPIPLSFYLFGCVARSSVESPPLSLPLFDGTSHYSRYI